MGSSYEFENVRSFFRLLHIGAMNSSYDHILLFITYQTESKIAKWRAFNEKQSITFQISSPCSNTKNMAIKKVCAPRNINFTEDIESKNGPDKTCSTCDHSMQYSAVSVCLSKRPKHFSTNTRSQTDTNSNANTYTVAILYIYRYTYCN